VKSSTCSQFQRFTKLKVAVVSHTTQLGAVLTVKLTAQNSDILHIVQSCIIKILHCDFKENLNYLQTWSLFSVVAQAVDFVAVNYLCLQ